MKRINYILEKNQLKNLKDMIDNFEIFEYKFNSDDEYRLIRLIARNKDNTELNGSIKTFINDNKHPLSILKERIKTICDKLHCRAYIDINIKSKMNTANKMLELISIDYTNKNFDNLIRLHEKASDQSIKLSKNYLLDIDTKNISIDTFKSLYENISIIETLNGYHIISSNKSTLYNIHNRIYNNYFIDTEVKENSPSILYIG